MAEKNQGTAERLTDLSASDVSERVQDIGRRVQTGIRETGENVRARMREVNVSEATIPDAFRKVPKLISPAVHAWLDVAVTGYFVVLGAVFGFRGKKGAATAALVNAGMVAGVSLFTDYKGTGEKPISFKLHGTLDALQATTAALAPVLHGFADEPESAFFYSQAGNELAVIATTDWDRGMGRRKQRKAA